MGEELVFSCPKCGSRVGISQGAFFRSAPTVQDVMGGEFGKRAADNLRRHPGENVFFRYDIYRCRCGVVRSKRIMEVYREGVVPWFPSEPPLWSNQGCRCPRCNRRMKETYNMPKRIRCSKCGSWMDVCDMIMFD